MTSRSFRLTTSLAVVAAALTGCAQDAPTGPETVRFAVLTTDARIGTHGGRPFATPLTQEIFNTPMHYTGDPNGTGEALITVNLGQREVCWDVSVADIEPLPASASHIHRAAVDVQGPIVVGLTPPDASGTSVGCVSNVSRDLLKEMLRSPESFYVNVHTTEFPTGAVRGQFGR